MHADKPMFSPMSLIQSTYAATSLIVIICESSRKQRVISIWGRTVQVVELWYWEGEALAGLRNVVAGLLEIESNIDREKDVWGMLNNSVSKTRQPLRMYIYT